ncbi:hypothetical protein TNIN_485311 [Trichonephila inaurata madagascariensis]|uniref:Uncharacterized protein n=1 Tax=Trichonephila inaurata madagascariensis TaxID=2747483 RepID=A0A8X6KF08_9ARAC|nr:hypothetical protein TNIN_485311 [Trichonephila inaurata madagascariensis]
MIILLGDIGFIPNLKVLTLLGIKIGPEVLAIGIKPDNIRIEHSEIRASDASEKARTARLEERTAENAFFEIEDD